MDAEIIAVGSELLTPFRQDTNSLFLTERLNQLGVDVAFKTIVGDSLPHLTQTARLAISRSDIIIFMGGLGPTEDDLTREAVAAALELSLRRDPEILAHLEQHFAARHYTFTPNNAKQADVIVGATVLPNANGTAPGQWITGKYQGRDKLLLLLPGPPHELKALFDQQCVERLRLRLPRVYMATRELKITGIGESHCDARVAPIYQRYSDIETTILAGAGEIQLHLKTRGNSFAAAQERVDELAGKIEEELGELVFSDNGDSMEQIVGYFLQMRGATLAVAESCTAGLIAERITSVSGSSRYFLGGAVVYSNELKTAFADVPAQLIQKHGAVSREVAAALAEGIRKRCGATFGIGVTGVAGPTGGTPEKPVGLVFHGLATETGTEVVERNFPGDRKRIRWFASQQALDMVEKKAYVIVSTRLPSTQSSMRLFVALDLDDPIRRRIGLFMEGVRGFAPDARWVRPESLHITLKFIGEKPAEAANPIQQALSAIPAESLQITFQGYGFFPTSRSPRVFWIGIQSGPQLAALAKSVDDATTALAIPGEEHPFSPHLTLARGGGGSGAPRRQKGDRPNQNFRHLQQKLDALPSPQFGTMAAHQFFLYESQLGPGGSRYRKIAAFPLGRTAQARVSDPND